MTRSTIILVVIVTLCSVCGASAFKQFSISRNVAWLILGVVAYNLSNIGWITLIDQSGLARASVMASAASIFFMTAIGALYGERLNAFHFAAAALAISAVMLVFVGDQHSETPTHHNHAQTEDPDV